MRKLLLLGSFLAHYDTFFHYFFAVGCTIAIGLVMAIPIAMIVIGKLSFVWGGGGQVGGTPSKFWDGRVLPESLACDGSLKPLILLFTVLLHKHSDCYPPYQMQAYHTQRRISYW